jgi:hypothetical protein
MEMNNESYVIWIRGTRSEERDYRDPTGWVKVSPRKRRFRLTAEQVLNHLLPALAGLKLNVLVQVERRGRGTGSARSGMIAAEPSGGRRVRRVRQRVGTRLD